MKKVIVAGILSIATIATQAQETRNTSDDDGLVATIINKKSSKKKLKVSVLQFDLGLNLMHDQTNYSDPATKAFLNVPNENQNQDLFALRQNKSVNVNIYPVLANLYLLNNAYQKISIYTGIGMQIFNFRFNKPIQFQNQTQPEVVMSNLHFSKNKLSVMYGTIPISLLMKTKLAGNTWLVYGFGIMGGVNMSTWTKQKSYEHGKVKNHDMFNLDRFNTTMTAEFGIDDRFRIFGTYQLTNMYKDGLVQNPYSIGIRLLAL